MQDLISRQAAIDGFYEMASDMDHLCTVSDYVSFLESLQPEQQWTPCSERLPERIINGDVETVQEFFVTVKERWPGEEWKYYTDVAEFPGDYIDDVWQTYNDWKEGQEVHVIAWMPLPEHYVERRTDE